MTKRTRVALIDPTPLFRSGVKLTLDKAGFDVVAESGATADALEIAETTKPDLILMEHSSDAAFAITVALLEANPEIALLIIVAGEAFENVGRYSEAGVKGCLLKDASNAELIAAVTTICSGGTYLSPELAKYISSAGDDTQTGMRLEEELTEKELLILSCVAKGETNKVIARKLGIGNQTLKNYMTKIMKKIHVRNRLEAALFFEKAKP